MTRLGLLDDASNENAPASPYFSEGSSMRHFAAKAYAEESQRLECALLEKERAMRRGGEEARLEFEARLRQHKQAFQSKKKQAPSLNCSLENADLSLLDSFYTSGERTVRSPRSAAVSPAVLKPLATTAAPSSTSNALFSSPTPTPASAKPVSSLFGAMLVKSPLAAPASPVLAQKDTVAAPVAVAATPSPLAKTSLFGGVSTTPAGSSLFGQTKPAAIASSPTTSLLGVKPTEKSLPATSATPAPAFSLKPLASSTPAPAPVKPFFGGASASTTPAAPIPFTPIQPSEKTVTPSIPVVSPPENKTEQPAPVAKSDSTSASSSSRRSLVSFYADECAFKREQDELVTAFNAAAPSDVRSKIKRTLREKIQINTKKTASDVEITATVKYLSDILSGQPVTGFNDAVVTLSVPSAIAFARDLILERYLDLVERDGALLDVACRTLAELCGAHPPAKAHLIGMLFARSRLLRLNEGECNEFLVDYCGKANDERLADMDREKTTFKIFCHIHTLEPFSLSHMWRTLALLLHAQPLPLVAPLLTNELLMTCGSRLHKIYSTQMSKSIALINSKFLSKLQDQLSSSEQLQKAGQASHISVLRNTMDSALYLTH